MRIKIAKVLAVVLLCLNIARYNLHGCFDTFAIFLLFDAISHALITFILFLVCSGLLLRNIFLFTFVLTLNAIHNAYRLNVTFTSLFGESVYLGAAVVAVILNTLIMTFSRWKDYRTKPPESKTL